MDEIAVCLIWLGSGYALALVTMRIVPYFIRAYWPKRAEKRDSMEWQDETNRAFSGYMESVLETARRKAYLASLVGQVPEGFDPAIWESFSIAARIESQVLAQAEVEGIVPEGMHDRIFVPTPPAAFVREEPGDEPAEPSNIRRLPSGRFLPKRASNGG